MLFALRSFVTTGVGKTEFYKKFVISIEPGRVKAWREGEILYGMQSSNSIAHKISHSFLVSK
ncbi:hypothetical protein SAMN05216464_12142 [Mucilaginibacter pineti]|uniref:Uncharacterized protein n=1 Tax=Mucilaginibacter pineti TaxID=1391627 RepID=A0A1G7MFC2_9SPHI|nr:hypothetical protein SAMN05216464_12142 [Mucilaginibacter pineti]